MGIEFILQDEKSSGDQITTWMYLTLLKCTLKNDKGSQFYFMHILPQLKIKFKKMPPDWDHLPFSLFSRNFWLHSPLFRNSILSAPLHKGDKVLLSRWK